jgi:threonine/homoserine efflux transporter RhtA
MSVNPVLAALVGIVVLGQILNPREWTGVLIVVAANAIATATMTSLPDSIPTGSMEATNVGDLSPIGRD